jgi:hypothetical protein
MEESWKLVSVSCITCSRKLRDRYFCEDGLIANLFETCIGVKWLLCSNSTAFAYLNHARPGH